MKISRIFENKYGYILCKCFISVFISRDEDIQKILGCTVEHRLYVFQGTVPKKRIIEKKMYNRKFVITL